VVPVGHERRLIFGSCYSFRPYLVLVSKICSTRKMARWIVDQEELLLVGMRPLGILACYKVWGVGMKRSVGRIEAEIIYIVDYDITLPNPTRQQI